MTEGLFYVAAAFYGFVDCTFQSLAGTLCTKSFASSGSTADAFALRWTFFGIGCSICFGISNRLAMEGGKTSTPEQLQTEIIITTAFMAAACAGVLYFIRHFNDGVESNTPVAKLGGGAEGDPGRESSDGSSSAATNNKPSGSGKDLNDHVLLATGKAAAHHSTPKSPRQIAVV